MSQDLHGLNVLVTRPGSVGDELARQIELHGGHAIHFPTITFALPPDLDQYNQAMAELDQQDWLIFISPQAVYSSISAIRRKWSDLPPKIKFAAIGEGTAQALKEAGYLVSACPKTNWNSEGLLALPEFQSIKGKKIAVIRGEGGRDYLENILKERGAQVLPVIAYQRVLPECDITNYLNLLKQKQIDVIICASFESISNLKKLMTEAGWPYLRNIPIIVVSERIKMLARDLDFQTIWVALNASHLAILTVLAQKKDELCQTKQMKS